ncbi:MAG: glycosyltransferase family 2 protein [Bacteroidota bacterium]
MISIIIPFYQSEKYLRSAIKSVLNQTYQNWELLLINDGSTDNSKEIALGFNDNRIRYFEQENKGVSSARNLGLVNMKGDFFCFLDADDVLTTHSLQVRLNVLIENPEIDFVDGAVQYVDEHLNFLDKYYQPNFKGKVFKELLRLNENCMFGNTWLIRRDFSEKYSFQTDMTHAEDLFFYLSVSKDRVYSFTNELILYYRQSKNSAMKDLKGLTDGYEKLIRKIRIYYPEENIQYLKKRIIRIIFLSWLVDGKNPLKAIHSIYKFLKLQ